MTSTRIIFAAAAATLLASPALADPPTGSRLGNNTIPGPTLTARDMAVGAKEAAACIYRQNPSLVRSALTTTTKAGSERVLERLHGQVECWDAVFANDLVEERQRSGADDLEERDRVADERVLHPVEGTGVLLRHESTGIADRPAPSSLGLNP